MRAVKHALVAALIAVELVAGAAIAADDAKIDLRFPEVSCPSRRQVMDFVRALGAARASAVVEVQRLSEAWRVLVVVGGRSTVREVSASGACDRQAAVIAAVIDRAVRSGGREDSSTRTATAAAVLDHAKSSTTSSSTTAIAVVEAGPAVTSTASAARAIAPEPAGVAEPAIAIGVLAAVGNTGDVDAGLALGASWIGARGLGFGARLVWTLPRSEAIGQGRVRVDRLRLDASFVVALSESVRGEVSLAARGVYARSDGIAMTDRALGIDPGAALGVTWLPAFATLPALGGLRFGASVRGHIFLRAQEFLVDNTAVVEVPRAEVELALEGAFAL